MKKYSTLFLSGLVIIFFALSISSCKDDPEPVKYQLTFSESSMTVDEAEGTLEIELKLDKPAPKDIEIDYSLGGTAYDDVRAEAEEEYSDYFIDSSYGVVEIEEGETSGIIVIKLYSDDFLEDDETIEITIDDVDEPAVEFDEDLKTEITLTQEDGIVVLLEWPVAGTEGVADMDIFARIGKTAANPDWDGIMTGSVYRGFNINFEYVFIPKTFTGDAFGLDYKDTTYGLTYTYYDGTLDPLDFTVTFIDVINGEFEPEDQQQPFEKTYTASNLNKWVNVEGGVPTIIAQTFRNNNGVFSDISPISVQETSSRVGLSSNSILNQIGRSLSKQVVTRTINLKNLPQELKNKLNRN